MQWMTVLTAVAHTALLIFVIGVIYRLARWFRASSSTNFRAQGLSFGEWVKVIANVFLDLVFMRKVFRSDEVFGTVVWLMHMVVLVLLVGHLRAFGVWSAEAIGEGPRWLFLGLIPTALGWLLFFLLLFLFVRRVRLTPARSMLTLGDVVLYALLLSGVLCGNLMRLLPTSHEAFQWRIFPWLTLSLEHAPNLAAFSLHVVLLSALLAYLPFSPLVHIFSGIVSSILHYKWRLQVAKYSLGGVSLEEEERSFT